MSAPVSSNSAASLPLPIFAGPSGDADAIAAAKAAAQAELKMVSAKILPSGHASASAPAIDPLIYDIAMAVKEKNYTKANVLLKSMPGLNPLKDRIKEIVCLPFHRYIHRNPDVMSLYKSLRILALGGDIKAQEAVDSWHAINAILTILHKPIVDRSEGITFYIKPNSEDVKVGFISKSDILYVDFGKFGIAPKREDDIIYISNGNGYFGFKNSKDTRFILLTVLNSRDGRCVIEGKMVNNKLEIDAYSFHANQIVRFGELIPMITADKLGKVPTDFSQQRIDEIMNFVKTRFFLYRHPSTTISLLKCPLGTIRTTWMDFKITENDPTGTPILLESPINPLHNRLTSKDWLAWTAPNQKQHCIIGDEQFHPPLDDTNQSYIYNDNKGICTITSQKKSDALARSFSIDFNRSDWEDAAAIYLEKMDSLVSLRNCTEAFQNSRPTAALFSLNSIRYLHLSTDSICTDLLCIEENGVWDSFHGKYVNVQNSNLRYMPNVSHFTNGIALSMSFSTAQSYVDSAIPQYSILIPPSEDLRQTTSISFNPESAENGDRFGFVIENRADPAPAAASSRKRKITLTPPSLLLSKARTVVKFKQPSPLDVIRTAETRRVFTQEFPGVLPRDMITMINQYTSYFATTHF